MTTDYISSSVTLLVGSVALIVYLRQRRDEKRDAANSILLEIQHAERVIDKVRDFVRKGSLDVDIVVLQADSWVKYKHLFSRDFDKDEWDSITEFYSKAKLLDNAIEYNNKGFSADVDQIRMNKQRILADFTKDLIDELGKSSESEWPNIVNQFKSKIDIFDQQYMDQQGRFAYNPSKPVNDAKIYLEDIQKITTTSVGQKLKKIAKQ